MCLLIKYHLPIVQNNKLYVCRPEVIEQVALSQDLVLQAMRLLYLLVRKTKERPTVCHLHSRMQNCLKK